VTTRQILKNVNAQYLSRLLDSFAEQSTFQVQKVVTHNGVPLLESIRYTVPRENFVNMARLYSDSGFELVEGLGADSSVGILSQTRFRKIIGRQIGYADELILTESARFGDNAVGSIVRSVDVGAAFLLDAGFQVFDDANEPFLTSGQRTGRVAIAGTGGALAAGAGLATGATVAWAIGAATPPAWVPIVGGVTFAYFYGKTLKPILFDFFGLNPSRQLEPLP